MTEIVLWVDELERAKNFYTGLLALEVAVDSPGYQQLRSSLHCVHLHEVPVEYRATDDAYAVREAAAIKAVFAVSSVDAAIAATESAGKVGKSFEHDGVKMVDIIDPEGNVVQISEAVV